MKTQPKEMDLNLVEMRAAAFHAMVDAMRVAVRTFDDIDALERVLHGEAAVEAQKRSAPQTNGNGNGHRYPLNQFIEEPVVKRGRPPGTAKPKRSLSKRTDFTALSEAALPVIALHPDGINSIELTALLRKGTKLFDPRMRDQSARTALKRALTTAVQEKRIRADRMLGTGQPTVYRPKATTASAAPAKRPAAPKETNGGGIAKVQRLRSFLMDTLIAANGQVVRTSDIYKLAIDAGGFEPKWGKGDTLRNQMSRVLREFAVARKLKAHGRGKGDMNMGYSVVRPHLQITKSPEAEARA